MKKFKICPICGEKNSPGLLECRICEADLTGVRVSTEESASSEKEPSLVRVCECGFANPPQARKCQSCGEDISDILPTPAVTEEKSGYELCSPDESFVYELCSQGCVIGREAEMDAYLLSHSYVSRRQAEIVISGNEIRIFNLSRTNPTFVNNEKVPEDGTVLHEGDEIGLGGKKIKGERQEKAAYLILRKAQ